MQSIGTGRRLRAIGPVGTIARIAGGFLAVALSTWGGIAWWEVVLGLLVIPLAVTSVHAVVARAFPGPLSRMDHMGVCVTGLVLFPLLLISDTRDATILWLAVSLIVAAVRGYAGCEILAISNALLRREDTVTCLVFTPIDFADDQFSRRKQS